MPKKSNSNDKVTAISAPVSPRFKSRTIYNSSKEIGESSNWKADCYKYKNLTYAEVLSLGKHNDSVSADHSSHFLSRKHGKNHLLSPPDKAMSTHKVPRDKKNCVKHRSNMARPKVSVNPRL